VEAECSDDGPGVDARASVDAWGDVGARGAMRWGAVVCVSAGAAGGCVRALFVGRAGGVCRGWVFRTSVAGGDGRVLWGWKMPLTRSRVALGWLQARQLFTQVSYSCRAVPVSLQCESLRLQSLP
jgi:hypothetical protein